MLSYISISHTIQEHSLYSYVEYIYYLVVVVVDDGDDDDIENEKQQNKLL
jgi:hypothetical protein